ncbi:hypothetical protein QQP08_001309 [Theobroma cacao]|nr:hypothetical protein QQP08_001309 [Theobroma cacao]
MATSNHLPKSNAWLFLYSPVNHRNLSWSAGSVPLFHVQMISTEPEQDLEIECLRHGNICLSPSYKRVHLNFQTKPNLHY